MNLLVSDGPGSLDHMGAPMLIGIAALAGGVAGGGVGLAKMREAEEWSRAIYERDLQLLAAGQPMPQVPAPPARPRQPRNGAVVFLFGPLFGAVLGFVAVAVFVQVLASMTPDATGATRVLGAVIWGTGGAIGGALLGVFLGIGLYLRELSSRAAAFNTALRRDAWEQRERLRLDVEGGRMRPDQAAGALQYAITN